MSYFTAIDFETATYKPFSICQVGLVVVEDCKIVNRISYLVKPPGNEYNDKNIEIHGITPEKTGNSEAFDKIYPKIKEFIDGKKLVAHNALFDKRCLEKTLEFYRLPTPKANWYCTHKIYNQSLKDACKKMGIINQKEHDALNDAEACALLMINDIQRVKATI